MAHLKAPWLTLPPLQHLFGLFASQGATLRLVGGSVRDGLLGLPVNDIDLAVDREPQWVMELLQRNHLKAIPTGIHHGTITAVLEKRPYQITTLRVDVKTFGRRAQVAFTTNWVQDALRRDFTINAIYADRTGHLFDPVGGIQDLKKHHVRFIGDAMLRIQEDYLRILRFFRFSARFGHKPYDEQGLKACEQYASHISYLARERVTEEFLKLLELPSPLYTFQAMKSTGVLTYILHSGNWGDLKAFIALEKPLGCVPSALLRLAAFHPALLEVKTHLRLSNKQESTIAFLTNTRTLITHDSFKHHAYLWGKERTFDLALLQTARRLSRSQISLKDGIHSMKEMYRLFNSWPVPLFPLTGDDMLSQGVKEGDKVGALLKAVEQWWIQRDLKPDRKECLAYLSTLL